MWSRCPGALPVNRPAAALHAQIIRRRAGDTRCLIRLGQRQNVFLIFQQHEGFAHAFARNGAMLRRADGGGQ
jgi:hypothetical protein